MEQKTYTLEEKLEWFTKKLEDAARTCRYHEGRYQYYMARVQDLHKRIKEQNEKKEDAG